MLRVVFLIIALLLMPIFSLGQERSSKLLGLPSPELEQYSNRYLSLSDEFSTALRRYVSTGEMHEKRRNEFDLLMYVGGELQTTDAELTALQGHLLLADMVTEKPLIRQARNFISLQYQHTKMRSETRAQYIERNLHVSRDQETTNLLLAARDLHRAVADYLRRLDAK